jgi:DNA topoisomerase IB
MWRVSKQLGMAGDEIRMRPGQVIQGEAGEIEMLNKGITTDVSSERLEQQAKAYAEEYLSITDFSQRSAVNQGSARTATELQLINQSSTRQVNMDIALFLDTLSEVANHMYLICKQAVTKPTKIGGVLLTPEDFLVKVIVSWSGSLDATDSQMQMAKAMQRMQTVMQFGQPMGIVTPTNVYNMLQDYIDKDPDVDVSSRFITTPEDVQLSELEEQQSEIVRMLNGFDVPVSPDDNDGIHLAVIEEWAASPQGAEAMKNPGFANLMNKHAQIHIQSEQMKNGIKAQKAAGTQGSLGDPRAAKAAATR